MTAPRARLDELLRAVCELEASDLHLTAGEPPRVRRVGSLEPLSGQAPTSVAELADLVDALLGDRQREALRAEGSLDLALSLPDGSRFRVNVFSERGRVALSIRRLDGRLRSLRELQLPASLAELADLEEGLVLFVGPTGAGKSTSLATLIDRINRQRKVHVVTLEDPIEYLHSSQTGLVRQRELHTDFVTFAGALRSVLREDPDVILVGEMRDHETMRAALMASETGHLVFSTLHAGGVVQAPERFVGAFPQAERDVARHKLSHVLRAVVAQRLLPTRDGRGRVPAVELLRVTPAIANSIRAGKPAQVASALQAGSAQGMLTLEQSLADLVRGGRVDKAAALRCARDPGLLEQRLRLQRGAR